MGEEVAIRGSRKQEHIKLSMSKYLSGVEAPGEVGTEGGEREEVADAE